ncbi:MULTISPECIES: hypothetical protein [unclassified Thermoactinomyces]|uniref:hypothetical protein n=1 Tax=unclassified Thermoactinomyces TaxID=2634588 RepID=UPI00051A89C2|nr:MULTISPECIES: hypothetical protein [unclassified Thermoactinomyces]MBH8604898.1 hypothetical protein [Thermoactinomyces sp. CICC 10522]MBH8608386.1 hypothetical protein [Thermoactinomyces sp. CICC 10521]
MTDKVAHTTTFSKNRRSRFNDTTIFRESFDEIVLQAIRHGLIKGKELFTDPTFLKANANKNRFTCQMVRQSAVKYTAEWDRAIDRIVKHTASGRPLKRNKKPNGTFSVSSYRPASSFS